MGRVPDNRGLSPVFCSCAGIRVRMDDCLFCKIVAGELPSTRVYEDDRVVAILDIFPARVDEYEDLLTNNELFRDRTVGVGKISAVDAIAWGLSGPSLRGYLNWRPLMRRSSHGSSGS